MATSLVVNGVSYLYPDTGDQSWGTVASAWAAAVTSGMLQKAGGVFTLTSDANFGINFGLLSLYFTSQSANAAASGIVRLANTEAVKWRNNANNADVALAKNASDQLTWAGVVISSSAGVTPVAAGGTGITSGTSGGILGFTGSTTIASSALLAQYGVVLGGGAGATPTALAPNASTAYPLVSGGASANPAWALLTVAGGGTGIASGTSGGIPYYSASTTIASSGALTASQLVLGGGTGSSPTSLAAGTQYQVLVMGASNPGYGQVNLAQSAAITGTLPVGNGGTGQASNLTQYGVIYASTTTAMASTAAGTLGYLLTSNNSSAPTYQQINLGSSPAITGTLGTGNGGTGVTSVTTSPTASSFAGWDANSNLSANAFIPGLTSTATAAGTTTMTIASTETQIWTGSTTQTVKLPTTGVASGATYFIVNNSSGVVTVQSSGGNTIQAMAASSFGIFKALVATPTTAANWNASYSVNNAGGGTVTSVAAAGPTGIATWSSAVTTSGTLTQTLSNQSANIILAGPSSGAAATPAFRALVSADLPTAVAFNGNRTATLAFTGTPAKVPFTSSLDSNSGWVTDTYTIQVAGTYTLAMVFSAYSPTTAGNGVASFYKGTNAVGPQLYFTHLASGADVGTHSLVYTATFAVNDTISLKISNSSGTMSLIGTVTSCVDTLTITRIGS